MTYVAPAAKVLTVLHKPEPGHHTGPMAGFPQTVCGLAMEEMDLWREVERQSGDALCAPCEAGERARPAEEVLW